MSELIETNNLEFIKENYALLEIALDEILNNDDIIATIEQTDILGGILDKINYVKNTYDLDEETNSELNNIKQELTSKIINIFGNNFKSAYENIQTNLSSDISLDSIASVIYYNFFINKREIIFNYLVETILTNKNQLIKKYKNKESKKDIEYQALRAELDIKNSELYVILVNYSDIIYQYLSDNSTSIMDVFACTDIARDNFDILTSIFEDNEEESFSAFMNGITDSLFYKEFTNSIRMALYNRIKKIQ